MAVLLGCLMELRNVNKTGVMKHVMGRMFKAYTHPDCSTFKAEYNKSGRCETGSDDVKWVAAQCDHWRPLIETAF